MKDEKSKTEKPEKDSGLLKRYAAIWRALLRNDMEPKSLQEVARFAGLNESAAYRMLTQMEELQMVKKIHQTYIMGDFMLSVGVAQMDWTLNKAKETERKLIDLRARAEGMMSNIGGHHGN